MLPWSLPCYMLPADDSNERTETKYHPLAECCTPAKMLLISSSRHSWLSKEEKPLHVDGIVLSTPLPAQPSSNLKFQDERKTDMAVDGATWRGINFLVPYMMALQPLQDFTHKLYGMQHFGMTPKSVYFFPVVISDQPVCPLTKSGPIRPTRGMWGQYTIHWCGIIWYERFRAYFALKFTLQKGEGKKRERVQIRKQSWQNLSYQKYSALVYI